MNMKLLSVVTPLPIYHAYSARKAFWEENFTEEEKFTLGEFSYLNMKHFSLRNVREHIENKVSYKYVTLGILLKFGSTDKTIITSSEPKDNLVISGKGLIASLGIKAKARPEKYKRESYDNINISMRDL